MNYYTVFHNSPLLHLRETISKNRASLGTVYKQVSDFGETCYPGVVKVGISEKRIRMFRKYYRVKIWQKFEREAPVKNIFSYVVKSNTLIIAAHSVFSDSTPLKSYNPLKIGLRLIVNSEERIM